MGTHNTNRCSLGTRSRVKWDKHMGSRSWDATPETCPQALLPHSRPGSGMEEHILEQCWVAGPRLSGVDPGRQPALS